MGLFPVEGWLAVDRDGHLAFFDPRNTGAVPREAPNGLEPSIARAARPTEAVLEIEGRLLPGLEAAADELHTPWSRPLARPVVLFLGSTSAVRADLHSKRAHVARGPFGTTVVYERLPRDIAARVHEEKACLGCFHEPEDERTDPATLGLFSYLHLCDGWVAGPYGRRASPTVPLTIERLGPAAVQLARGRRFDAFCFADVPHLQPLDWARCVATVPAFLAIDGKTVRPIPGRESEYRQFFLPRHRRDPRFLVERV